MDGALGSGCLRTVYSGQLGQRLSVPFSKQLPDSDSITSVRYWVTSSSGTISNPSYGFQYASLQRNGAVWEQWVWDSVPKQCLRLDRPGTPCEQSVPSDCGRFDPNPPLPGREKTPDYQSQIPLSKFGF
jgi:hypothetical protein